MRRLFALHTEVFRRADQADTEELLPIAVNRNACRERMIRLNQPLSQAEPVARSSSNGWSICSTWRSGVPYAE